MSDDKLCKICAILTNPNEKIHYQDDLIVIADTLYKCGHEDRFMVYTKRHLKNPPTWLKEYAIHKLEKIGLKIIGNNMIIHGKQDSIPLHWHKIGCDLYGDDIYEFKDSRLVK